MDLPIRNRFPLANVYNHVFDFFLTILFWAAVLRMLWHQINQPRQQRLLLLTDLPPRDIAIFLVGLFVLSFLGGYCTNHWRHVCSPLQSPDNSRMVSSTCIKLVIDDLRRDFLWFW